MERDPMGLLPNQPGAKLDDGKVLAGCLLDASRALTEIGKVFSFGARKYSRGGWQHVPNGVERYTDAMLRHLLAEQKEGIDPDSGMLHAAQVAWNAIVRLDIMLREMEHAREKVTAMAQESI